jgi:uncharacterized integral membrane protein (TIGR00697 family)
MIEHPFKSRRDLVFLILGAFFITNAILAELIGGKLFVFGPFTMSLGVIGWPIVFLMTDLINEYFGKQGVRRLTFITVGMIIFVFGILYIGMQIPAASFSPISDAAFNMVFGQSLWIIVGSLIAFLLSQMIDVTIFWFFREKTGEKKLWLRATGSTAISQLIDTFVVLGIAFWLPGILRDHFHLFSEALKETSVFTSEQYLTVSISSYTYKLLIALLMTPVIYMAHKWIDNFLASPEA